MTITTWSGVGSLAVVAAAGDEGITAGVPTGCVLVGGSTEMARGASGRSGQQPAKEQHQCSAA
jgi:hypothetical protein